MQYLLFFFYIYKPGFLYMVPGFLYGTRFVHIAIHSQSFLFNFYDQIIVSLTFLLYFEGMGGYIYKHYSQVIEIPGIELEKPTTKLRPITQPLLASNHTQKMHLSIILHRVTQINFECMLANLLKFFLLLLCWLKIWKKRE